jgi:predicted AlkP superfamily pyrophosphatase or phosphodiesterase
MLPSAPKSLGRLGEVLTSALASIVGESNKLGLQPKRSVCVILVDGLGAQNLRVAGAHAGYLNSQPTESAMCWFPATTATSITSFATGTSPSTNGFLGYQVYDRANQKPMNLLSGWANFEEGFKYQASQTIAEQAISKNIQMHTVAPSAYERSGFTAATMRGSVFHGMDSIEQRFEEAKNLLEEPSPKLIYLYVPELDQLAHAKGSESLAWLNLLEDLDALVKSFTLALPKSVGVLLTADHGVVDVPKSSHIYLDEVLPASSFRFVGGDTRALYLYLQEGIDLEGVKNLLRESYEGSCYLATPRELVAANYWSELSAKSENVAPDLVLFAKKRVALYHRGFAKAKSLEMIGHHGSISPEELAVPLLKFGF